MSDQHRHGSWDPRIPWRLQPLPQWERPSQLREPKLPGLPMTVISINRPTLEFIFDHLWSWFLVPNFDLCIISNVPYYFISSKVILYNISWLESNLGPCCFVKYPQLKNFILPVIVINFHEALFFHSSLENMASSTLYSTCTVECAEKSLVGISRHSVM